MKSHIIKGTLWNGAATYISLVVRLLGTIIIARMFTPEDFGTITYIISIYALGSMILAWGSPPFIIKTKKNVAEAVKATVQVQTVLYAGFGILFIILYPVFFEPSKELLPIVIAVALSGTLNSIAGPHVGWMTKNMEFKKFSLITICSDIASIGIALLAALQGAGIWAVALLLVLPDALVGILQMILVKLPRHKAKVRKKQYKDIFHFGKYIVLSSIFDKTYRQTDDVVVKNVMGTAALGIYNQAYKLSELFSNITFGAIGVTAGSVFGKYQDDKNLLARNFHTFTAVITRVILFIYIPFFLLAPQAILFVYGEQWVTMAIVVQALVVYAVLSPMRRIIRLLNQNVGRSKLVALSQWNELVVFLILLFPGVYFFGLVGAAIAVNVGIIVGLTSLIRRTKEHMEVRTMKILLPPIISAVTAGVLYMTFSSAISIASPFLSLAVRSVIICAMYATTLLLLERKELFILMRQVIRRKA